MKKQFLLLAGTAIILASCGSNNDKTPAQTQAQIDSAMNAKLAEHDAQNAAKNDSTLKAIEKEKAEAMAKEHEHAGTGKKHEGGKKQTEPAPTPAPTPAPPPPPANPKESRFNDGASKPAVDPSSTKKKEDRFK